MMPSFGVLHRPKNLCLHHTKEFPVSFKKETASAKSEGQLDDQEADLINPTLFQCILQWAIEKKNIYIWVFSLCQWHFMARSINIGVLALHNF